MNKDFYSQGIQRERSRLLLSRTKPQQLASMWQKMAAHNYVYDGLSFRLLPEIYTKMASSAKEEIRLLLEIGVKVNDLRASLRRSLESSTRKLKRIIERYGYEQFDPRENDDLLTEWVYLVVHCTVTKAIPSSNTFGIQRTGRRPFTVENIY